MENKTFWIIVVVLTLGVGFVLLQPTVEDKLAPTLETAWVAIQVEGSEWAEVGPVEIESDTPFTLHAVIQGKTRGGEDVFYTEAEKLRIDGREIDDNQLQAWNRNRPVKIRWYTLEGRWPYLPLGDEGISTFRYESFLRSDWPLAWSIPGDISPANDDHLHSEGAPPRPALGTQRYRTQLELYNFDDDLMPVQTVRSWDVEDLRREIDRFPTVRMVATDGAKEVSKFLGLTQLEPPAEASEELLRQIDELTRHGIAFSRSTLLRDLTESADTRFSELTWQQVDLTGVVEWGAGASPGDLLRVGDRVVVLYEDRDGDRPGMLDYQDLCFDIVQGIEVRALEDVFSGEGQDVEIARLQTAAADS